MTEYENTHITFQSIMHSFKYKNGTLHCEDVDVQTIAEVHGSPTYIYSAETIKNNYQGLDSALDGLNHAIEYAVKANSNLSVLKLLVELGSGFDIVSAGELQRVLAAGGAAGKCTFAGVGKTFEEISYCLEKEIYCFNAESAEEVEFIDQIAGQLGKKAPIALRVNPNVDAKTHAKITTGKKENKFGIDFEYIEDLYARFASLENIELKGIQMHIGSQLTDDKPFLEAIDKVAPLATKLKELYDIEFFSIGGGIGIVYDDTLASGEESWWSDKSEDERPLTYEKFAAGVVPRLQDLGLKILLEPGRCIVGNAGILITKCIYEKKGEAKTFKIVDAGMNELIRPALYEGFHQIVTVKEPVNNNATLDVVGPICESSDFWCKSLEQEDFKVGEYIALMSAGAYGFVMASNYNTRGLPTEVLVSKDTTKVVRPKQTVDEILASEIACL